MGATQKMDVSVNIVQNFSDTQKAQARTNIGAAAASDLSNKADKVTGATADDVATLDANGNLVDSGVTLDPSTNTISANINGNAATATTATNATTADKLGSANVGLPCMPIYLYGGTPMSIEGYFFSPLAEPSTRNLSANTTLNAVGGGKYVYNVSTSNTFNLTLASTANAPIAFVVRLKCTANCPNVYVTYNDAVEKTTLTRNVYLTSGQMVDMCFTYYYGYFHLVSFMKNVS